MKTYLVAIKRQHRHRMTDDWATALESIEGVEAAPEGLHSTRLRIKATPSGIARVRESLGDLCHVEPLIPHPLAGEVEMPTTTSMASTSGLPKAPDPLTDDEIS